MTLQVPAVSADGEGIIVDINVELKPGSGKTLVNIDQILFWTDTQDSIRVAKAVAQNVTGVDMSQYDVIYSIGAQAEAIEGPSAGAAMAIATSLLLESHNLKQPMCLLNVRSLKHSQNHLTYQVTKYLSTLLIKVIGL